MYKRQVINKVGQGTVTQTPAGPDYTCGPVSYTHLDVYKRQDSDPAAAPAVTDDESAMPPLVGGAPKQPEAVLSAPADAPEQPGTLFQNAPNAPAITTVSYTHLGRPPTR